VVRRVELVAEHELVDLEKEFCGKAEERRLRVLSGLEEVFRAEWSASDHFVLGALETYTLLFRVFCSPKAL